MRMRNVTGRGSPNGDERDAAVRVVPQRDRKPGWYLASHEQRSTLTMKGGQITT